MTDESILGEAERIGSERQNKYGSPVPNMRATARLWSAYLATRKEQGASWDELVRGEDVAQMMLLLKMARFQTGDPTDRDNFVDEAGYARVTADVVGVNADD